MTDPQTILIVDDEKQNVKLLNAFLRPMGYRLLIANNGREAIDVVKHEDIDLIILDINMPVLSGIEVCKILKNDPKYQLIPIILVSALNGQEVRIEGIDVGAIEFISKPVDLKELEVRVKSSLKLKKLTDHLESAEEVLIALAAAVAARDDYTGEHVDRVTATALAIGKSMNLSPEDLEGLRKGARLHDVGKIGIPDKILLKPGKLDDEEFNTIKQHSRIGYDLCRGLKTIGKGLDLVLMHHEKLDGSGYPRGLLGKDICLPVRILTVADIFDALTSTRAYRNSLSLEQSFEILFKQVEENKIDGDVFGTLRSLCEKGAEFCLAS
ncbi:MAG: response regulator [Candidatus Nitronauta litoralis]|uniref:Response regulator n=1 Tax=Candidatus Nitronauta litoralis TaxID=2705533 RepID=A0A7T0BVT2_9BACT|nr:MAG: response regulator [Candidatus Nitronauta litoralis]